MNVSELEAQLHEAQIRLQAARRGNAPLKEYIAAGEAVLEAETEFAHCYACRFSNINEEVLTGHPLYGKGLDFYGAHEVIHSQWLAEVQRINMVHEHYNPQQWAKLRHYLLVFHDSIFECLADGYKIEILQDSLEHVTELARVQLFELEINS